MKSLTNAFKGSFGEKFVAQYLTDQGYTVTPSQKNGSDLIVRKGKKFFCVEVKTSGNLKGGIPDMHSTEFYKKKGQWFFVADYLYVVRLGKNNKPVRIDVLTRKEIDSYAGFHRTVIRIRTTTLGRAIKNLKVGKIITELNA